MNKFKAGDVVVVTRIPERARGLGVYVGQKAVVLEELASSPEGVVRQVQLINPLYTIFWWSENDMELYVPQKSIIDEATEYLQKSGPRETNDAIARVIVATVRDALEINQTGYTWDHIELLARYRLYKGLDEA